VQLIDAHCHASPLWFEPVETLVFQMNRHAVEKAVLTQILGQFDNSYHEECLARFPGRFASVGAVDAGDAAAPQQVSDWARRGMTGLRLRPEARSPGVDPLAIWRAATDSRLAVSCGGSTENFLSKEFAQLAAEFSSLPLVLEHLGGWTRPDCHREEGTWQGILALARFPNVSLKIPALGQLTTRRIGSPLPKAPPVLDASKGAVLLEALDAFGAERLLWGSDFPVVASREGYANALNWTLDLFAARSQPEVQAIFGGNAERIFFTPAA
jgi:L-fuconolactonase